MSREKEAAHGSNAGAERTTDTGGREEETGQRDSRELAGTSEMRRQSLCKSSLERIGEIPGRIAGQRPLVHMIPNSVTVALCTDGLSALGARPLMAQSPQEMEEIVSHADAVVVNMGQPSLEKLEAARIAIQTAGNQEIPLVFDPVGAGASGFRQREYGRLLQMKWKGIIKGNRSEAAALQSGLLSHQGIDSIGEFDLRMNAERGRVWAVSGPEDLVFDETRRFVLPHRAGRKMMLTGSGCLTGAVMGACCCVEPDPVTAALAAFLIMAYAGEKAAAQRGYGSQKTALLDALTEIDSREFGAYLMEIQVV